MGRRRGRARRAPPAPGSRPRRRVRGATRRRESLRPPLRRDRSSRSPSVTEHGGSSRTASTRPSTSRPVGDGIDADLATRDFTFNAIAVSRANRRDARPPRRPRRSRRGRHPGGLRVDLPRRSAPASACRALRGRARLRHGRADRGAAPRVGGARDAARRRADPRRARAALADRLPPPRRRRPARTRLGGELDERLDALDDPDFRLVVVFGENLARLPISNELKRYCGSAAPRAPARGSVSALRSTGSGATPSRGLSTRSPIVGAPELVGVVEAARLADPSAPLVRGDELGLEPGPEIGRILDVIEEERAAGTISTRDEALALARGLASAEERA